MFPYMDLKFFRNKPLKVTELTDNFLRVGCLTRSKPASFLNDVTMITARACIICKLSQCSEALRVSQDLINYQPSSYSGKLFNMVIISLMNFDENILKCH